MITAKEAAQKAIEYFNDFYSGHNYTHITVEEVELSDGKWLITLGYFDQSIAGSALPINVNKRRYKIFTVHASTGEVKSMKIRKVE